VNKAVHHTANGHKMIIVDTEEYRKRREESLVALAEASVKGQEDEETCHGRPHERPRPSSHPPVMQTMRP